MPTFVGDAIVLAVVGLVVFFAARSLYKRHKSGATCAGDCSSCGGSCGCGSVDIKLPDDFDPAAPRK